MGKKADINFAQVENTRPPLYTAIKYWGKKPHNIWRNYIDHYTPEGGVYLDPFTGSSISAFEAFKLGRKAVVFDLNPLSTFMIEFLASEFNEDVFKATVQDILEAIKNDQVYKDFFKTICENCAGMCLVQHYKWDSGSLCELGYICACTGKPKKYLKKPGQQDIDIARQMQSIQINTWYPQQTFHDSPSFTSAFVQNIGGNNFSCLWTKRNLYVLSKIFDRILKIKNKDLQIQLLSAFIKSIHLCSKMCVPRRSNAKRPFSTSWGRAAYIAAARQMEMNPLLVFEGSCIGKQSVQSALVSARQYFDRKPKLHYVDRSNRSKRATSYDIKYGIIDVAVLDDYVDEKSVDFILTDPPYGGLVQYMDLSMVWLVWLAQWDKRMQPDYDSEITIKGKNKDLSVYQRQFTNAMKQMKRALKDEGKLAITFHNKELKIWNSFLRSVTSAGFRIEKVIHQQNRRSGESNVANPYGTSANDFYIRCIKSPQARLATSRDEFRHHVINEAIRIIAERNEPTPYQFLFNGLLVSISEAGFDLQDFDSDIQKILSLELDKIFTLRDSQDKRAGDRWWFVDPGAHIKYPDRKLADRVDDAVVGLLRRKISVSLDDVLAEIFEKYPNGLTPTQQTITQVLQKYADKKNDKWKYKGAEIEERFTKHTEIIGKISDIGKRMGYQIYIGKREQYEQFGKTKLGKLADITNLSHMNLDKYVIKRAEMIDELWLRNDKIECAIEVENSTSFTSGIQRASNLGRTITKLMVVPDGRETEIRSIRDKLFVDSFSGYGWRYMTYTDVNRVASGKKPSWDEIKMYQKALV